MTSEWPSLEIGAIAKLRSGFAFKSADWKESGVPVLKIANIKAGRVNPDGCGYVSDQVAQQAVIWFTKPGDILISMTGYVGEVAEIKEGERYLINQRVGRFEFLDYQKIDPKYFFYHLQLPKTRAEIEGVSHGSAQPNLSASDAHKIKITLPPIGEQQKIASFLCVLDDRITLLRETNKTLEAIAQAIFKSWFIDFDSVRAKMEGRAPAGMDEETAALFPDELVESELGLVPKGWELCSLRDVVDIFDSKRIPLSGAERSTRKGPFPYYGAASLMDYVDDYLFDGVHLLMGEDGTVTDSYGYPVTQYVWGKFWVNNHAHILKGKNGISTEHVMLSLKRTKIQSLVTGAVQAKLSQSNMWKINFLNPTGKIAENFGQILDPLYKRYRHNVEMERTLEGLRDTLLPRLISGRLRPQVDLNAEVV